MSTQEKMIEKLKSDLNVKVEQYFNSIDGHLLWDNQTYSF